MRQCEQVPFPQNRGQTPVGMATAYFCFHSELSVFLKREWRGARFSYDCARAANLKNAIEALGVPHTEVGAVRVNGDPATLQRTVREGDDIRAVRGIEAHDDVPVTGQILGEGRVIRHLGRGPCSHDHDGIRSQLRGHIGVMNTVPMNLGRIFRQKSPETAAGCGRRPHLSWHVVVHRN